MIKLGIIGINEGNGHPYSFSAIINGYNISCFNRQDWDVIYQYLQKCHNEDFLNQSDVQISHVYTQNHQESQKIAQSCNIPNIANNLEKLITNTDGIILAMDTWETHLSMTKQALESGKFVFIDKPLTLDANELDYFSKFLKSGKLMSCSGLIFARELDEIRRKVKNNEEKIMFIEGSIGYPWDRYLIHLIDAILGITSFEVDAIKVLSLSENIHTVFIQTDTFPIQLNNRNSDFMQPATLQITTEKNRYTYTLSDNFSAFRRTMGDFIKMIKNKPMQYDYKKTLLSMNILQSIKKEFKNA